MDITEFTARRQTLTTAARGQPWLALRYVGRAGP